LAVGASLFVLTRRLYPRLVHGRVSGAPSASETTFVALFAAAVWLLHPIQASTALYAVQRMTVLMTLFLVWGLLLYWEGREQMLRGRRRGALWAFAGLIVAGGLAVLSKPNGALIAVYILVLEATALRFRVHPRFPRWLARTVFAVPVTMTVAVFARLALAAFHASQGTGSDVEFTHDFSLGERLLTEARIVWFYLREIFLPFSTDMGIYWAQPNLSTGLWQPPITLAAVLGLVAAVLVAIRGVQRGGVAVLPFLVLWFLTGHLIESTVVPLELIFEHRNYLALYGPALALAALTGTARGWIGPVFAGVVLAGVAVLLAQRVAIWSDADRFYRHQAETHPRAYRIWRAYAQYLEGQDKPGAAIAAYQMGQAFFPKEPGYPLGQWYLRWQMGRPVPDAVRKEAIGRLRQERLTKAAAYQLYRLVCETDRPAAVGALLTAAQQAPRSTETLRGFVQALAAKQWERRGEAERAGTLWQDLPPERRRQFRKELRTCGERTD
ncbi:MAG TPA: hypothetical protein VKA64_04280, partial [Gammaproteobacteria bacterium]|nr:hypothetical protein [Gammaproteobacteria bacterium]